MFFVFSFWGGRKVNAGHTRLSFAHVVSEGRIWPSLQSAEHLEPFSSTEPTILMVCARDRDLWQGPKQEVGESRTSGFYAQPQKFETITVTIGYKNGQLLRLRVTWPLPEVSIPGADQKDGGLWGRE